MFTWFLCDRELLMRTWCLRIRCSDSDIEVAAHATAARQIYGGAGVDTNLLRRATSPVPQWTADSVCCTTKRLPIIRMIITVEGIDCIYLV